MHRVLDRLPEHVRLPLITSIYGTAGGLITVAFMLCVNTGFHLTWQWVTAHDARGFILCSLLVVTVSSLLTGILMATLCPAAAGSGIPQLKVAYWKDLGEVPVRAVIVKFIGGVIALAGGASLGREGPTVFFAGGFASTIAGWMGIHRRQRRHAAASGAAAGLAAAFNTPLAAISFVLEELLGDLNSRLLGSVVLASVAGAFVVYALLGKQPSFLMPAVDAPTWNMYAVVPLAAALGTLAGVIFQRGALGLRRRMRGLNWLPAWLKPLAGGLMTWLIGCGVYLWVGHLGVFGLGYDDLSDALAHGIGWQIAGLLAVAKLVATIFSYGSGGCGGIFSPTLFIGAMCGFLTAGVAQNWIPLTPADVLIVAATGMSACLGSVVRAPFSSILIIFEMTHQFGMVPALMLGTLISQALTRLAGKHNFYDELLRQDGHEIHKIVPPRDLSAWRNLPVSAMASKQPVVITSLVPAQLRTLLVQHPYRCFPVVLDGVLQGVVTRSEIGRALAANTAPEIEKPVVCLATQTLQAVEPHLIESTAGLFLLTEVEGGPLTGVFTLHDLLRAQAALQE